MKDHLLNFIAGTLLSIGSCGAVAGVDINGPSSVPVDSPWAIAGIGAIVAVVAARILINQRK